MLHEFKWNHTVFIAFIVCLYSGVLLAKDYEKKNDPFSRAIETWEKKEVKKILGGKEANIGQLPWQVSLGVSWIDDPYYAHYCGGVIYSNYWIITAAHCVDGKVLEEISVTAGTVNLIKSSTRRNVEKVIVYGSYNNVHDGKDIALVKLKEPFILSKDIQAIPIIDNDNHFDKNAQFTVSGFGVTAVGSELSRTLQYIDDVPFISRARCNLPGAHDDEIKEDMMCAGFGLGGQDACQGDSGSGLIQYTSDGPVVVGIVSMGRGCGQPMRYGVYTRISTYSKWIVGCVKNEISCMQSL